MNEAVQMVLPDTCQLCWDERRQVATCPLCRRDVYGASVGCECSPAERPATGSAGVVLGDWVCHKSCLQGLD